MNKKPTFLFILVLFLSFLAKAQVQEPFTARFNQSLQGDFTIIANNMISRTATGDYNGSGNNDNYSNNVYVDIDNDNSTFNSSNAVFTNPDLSVSCISLFKAFIYWAAADTEKPGGADNQPNWNFDDVKIMLPGETSYTTFTADDVIFRGRDTHFSNDPYVCFKDITNQVLALPDKYGIYQVANVEGAEGQVNHDSNVGVSGGWQIVFVYESPELPPKNITLFDGYAYVNNQGSGTDIIFNGFQTTPTGNVNVNMVMGAMEGDRGYTGDRLQILDVSNNFVNITAPLRSANNFFNSRITVGNGDFTNRTPASTNTLGFDASVWELDNPGNSIITNNQTSATLRFSSTSEVYSLYLLGLAIEVYQPSLQPMVITQTSGTNPADPGDILGFNFNIENTGNDNALNVTLTTTIPPQVTLQTITNLPNGITYTYDTLTRELVFLVDDGMMDVGDPAIDINIELQINEECYFLEDDCDLNFDLQFTATYVGEENPDQIITLSTADPNSCLATPYTVQVNQPIVNWLTAAEALDTVLSCDDTAGLTVAQNLEPEPDKCQFTLLKTSGPFIEGSCPNTGTITNTWNFTDACGVTISDYVQIITIIDNVPPTASDPATLNVVCIEDVPAPDVEVVTDEADNCSNPTVAFVSEVSDNQSCPETITRTYSVTDACNNSINVTQLIVVNDDVLPTASDPATLNVVCIDDIPTPDIEVVTDEADNCSNPIVAFVSDVSNNQSCPETITRTYSVTDYCNNSINVTQLIVVNDDVLPTASDPATLNVVCIDDIPTPDIEVVTDEADNCSNPIVAFVSDVSDNQSCPETITRTYSVTDYCNNSINITQLIVVIDDVLPTASDPITLNLACIEDVPAPDVEVVTDEADNCSIPMVEYVSESSSVNQSCPETITRTYRVTDECNNSIYLTHLIVIYDDIPPTASDPATLNIVCIDDVPAPDIEIVTDEADNCAIPIVTFVSDVSDNQSCPETITRTYSITDACNNSINVTQLIIINGDDPPELLTEFDREIHVTCEKIPEIPILEFSANCSTDLIIEFDEEIIEVNDIDYNIIRTWIVTDSCDNQSVFTQIIYVRPTIVLDFVSISLCVPDDTIDLTSYITNTNIFTGEWQSSTIDLLDGSMFDPSNSSVGNFEFTYSYSENDCSWTTVINIAVDDDCVNNSCISSNEDVTISKLVTANNDGHNDFFEVKYVLNLRSSSNSGCGITIDVELFNRWGTRVFQHNNYNNKWNGFSPSNAMGSSGLLPSGTYYYLVTLTNSGLDPIQGFILLTTN